MLTRQLIEITFNNAIAQANKLDDCADDMLRLANREIADIKNDIHLVWQGDSANAYMDKMTITAANIVTTARKLQETAKTIRSVANIFRNTELRAIAIAEQRTY